MSLDAFSVVVAFLAAVEVVLGVMALVLAVRELRRPAATDGAPDARRPLLALVAATLVAVALASWPLVYLLEQSWVSRWPGVMCVEGVRRIGSGSDGAAGFLPGLVTALDVAKPLVVFVAGAWLVMRRGAGVAVRRAAFAAAALGLLAAFDGAAQGAYVAIPKEETPAASGCCTMSTHESVRDAGLTPAGADGAAAPRGLVPAYAAAAVILGLGALAARRGGVVTIGRTGRALLAAGAAASLPLGASVLAHVVAPAVLRMPYHHCVWCAFAAAPETIAGASLHLAGVFCAGWAWTAGLGLPATGGDPSPRLYGAAGFCLLGAAAVCAGIVLGA